MPSRPPCCPSCRSRLSIRVSLSSLDKDDAIDELARLSAEINETVENIGAHRLHRAMEKLLEEISFAAYVCDHVSVLAKKGDLSKFVL